LYQVLGTAGIADTPKIDALGEDSIIIFVTLLQIGTRSSDLASPVHGGDRFQDGGAQILELGGIEKLWADHKALVAIGRDLFGRY